MGCPYKGDSTYVLCLGHIRSKPQTLHPQPHVGKHPPPSVGHHIDLKTTLLGFPPWFLGGSEGLRALYHPLKGIYRALSPYEELASFSIGVSYGCLVEGFSARSLWTSDY